MHPTRSFSAALAASCLLTLPALAESGYPPKLRAALDLHDDATNLAEEQEALKAFEAVAAAHPEAWLPSFWASYLQTQVGRLVSPDEVVPYLDRAQARLDVARKLAGEGVPPRDRAAIEVLQSLILSFQFIRHGDDRYETLRREALDTAMELDPEAPTLLTMVGVGLIQKARAERDPTLAFSGRFLLARAKETFDRTRDRSTTTDMNSEWIPFWLPMADDLLDELNSASPNDDSDPSSGSSGSGGAP